MAPGFRISSALWDRIHHFASFPQTGVSLQQMVLFGQHPSQLTLLKASQFLAEELPVRLAHRVKELDELPHGLSGMKSIQKVRDWYAESFEELITFPPPANLPPEIRSMLINPPPSASSPSSNSTNPSQTLFPTSTPNPSLAHIPSDFIHTAGVNAIGGSNGNGNGAGGGQAFNKLRIRVPMERRYYAPGAVPAGTPFPPSLHDYNLRFTKLLQNIKARHDPTVMTVAQGVLEWKREVGAQNIGLDIQAWLDRFYMSRIGIRFLIGQHVALNTQQSHEDYVGIICKNACIHDILQESIENARFVCEEHYAMFRGPPVQLICPPNLTFPYVPGHLSHICFELLKNSLRAVVERYGVDAEDTEEGYPPIKIIVVEGNEDITIKISDEGGGIRRSAVPLIWTYMYTTMNRSLLGKAGGSLGEGEEGEGTTGDFKAPMAGFGYGLPLSRLYARYFGGDLKLISMDGFGTDVYIHLNKLSSSREPLP